MSDPVIIDVSGLQLSNNTFSASPPGALNAAENLVISQKGVVQLRNGQDRASTLPLAGQLPFSLVEFQQHILANYSLSKTTNYGLGYVNGGVISQLSTQMSPFGFNGAATDYARMHFVLASLFLHFCSSAGPYTLEAYNVAARRSGLSRVPDFTAYLFQPTGSQPGVVPYNSSVAYVYTHKRVVSTGQVQISPPSNRFVVTNRFLIPAGGLVRTGGVLVTATITPAAIWNTLIIPFTPGGTVTLSPGEANFAAGTSVISGIPAANKVAWPSGGANVASTLAQEMNPGPLATTVVIRLPADAVADDIIQLYKSVATSNSAIEPSQDVYLSDEHLLTAGDIAAGQIQFFDYTPESVLRVPLYTNPTDGDGFGLVGSNFAPPMYLDAANWDSRTFYLGTTGQQYLDLQMLGVGGPNGIQDGDTITIFDGVATTKTFAFKLVPAAGDIPLISDGTPSYNIAWTTYFLTLIANATFVPLGVGIFGGTSPNGFPGAIRIERTDYLQTPVQVKASRPTSWSPALQAAVFTNSFGSSKPNGLSWGKLGQPEAVPPVNALSVGVSSFYGRRCFGLRNALIILKEGEGVWTLNGSGGNYSLQQISTANIIAPDCACVFADSVWAYTDQGILRISDTGGTTVVSRPIETVLNALATAFPTETYAWSFAVPYETERRIMFFVPVAAASTANGGAPQLQAYVHSQATNAWTGPLVFNGAPVSGIVTSSHLLWVGLFDSVFATGRLTAERKTGTVFDIADAAWPNVLAVTGDPLIVQLATAGAIQQGTGISQGNYFTKVSQVLGGGQYKLAETFPWANGACTIYDPFPVELQFLPESSPGARKALARLFTLYKPDGFANLFGRTTLQTDQIQAVLEIPTHAPGYGSTPYGTGSYGNPPPMVVDTNPIDAKWANAAQFFPGFRLNEVWCKLKLQGLGLQLESSSAPTGRGK